MTTIGPVTLTPQDVGFLETLRACLRDHRPMTAGAADLQSIWEQSGLPKQFWGFAVTIYQPGNQRLMVVRSMSSPATENVRQTIKRVLAHPRVGEFDLADRQRCRIQVDFIVDEPEPVELNALSQSALDASRFEMGIDGLRIAGPNPNRCRYLLPGDAFVWSILSLGQLRKHIGRLFPKTQIGQLQFSRFRSASYVSTSDGWVRLVRGYPAVTPVTKASLLRAADAGVQSIVRNQQSDGRFLYYYDAATDSRRDHEHPTRNPETDPYYNLLRHCGGVITILLYHAFLAENGTGSGSGMDGAGPIFRDSNSPPTASEAGAKRVLDAAALRQTAESGIDFYLKQLVPYVTPAGRVSRSGSD